MPGPTIKTGIRIEGIEEWEKAVSPEVFQKTLLKGITDATIHLEGELIENTPTNKNTGAGTPRGRLAAAWTHVIQGLGRVTKGIIGNNVFYGPFVNFGTGTWVGNSRIREVEIPEGACGRNTWSRSMITRASNKTMETSSMFVNPIARTSSVVIACSS